MIKIIFTEKLVNPTRALFNVSFGIGATLVGFFLGDREDLQNISRHLPSKKRNEKTSIR